MRFSIRTFVMSLLLFASSFHVTSALVLGIDLGSLFFKVALVKPGNPFTIVTNTASKRKTETAMAFNDENARQFAGDAKNLMTRKPLQTFTFARTLLGRNSTHPITRKVSETFLSHHTLVEDDTRGSLRIKNSLYDVRCVSNPYCFQSILFLSYDILYLSKN